jgi:hypothetical protein
VPKNSFPSIQAHLKDTLLSYNGKERFTDIKEGNRVKQTQNSQICPTTKYFCYICRDRINANNGLEAKIIVRLQTST